MLSLPFSVLRSSGLPVLLLALCEASSISCTGYLLPWALLVPVGIVVRIWVEGKGVWSKVDYRQGRRKMQKMQQSASKKRGGIAKPGRIKHIGRTAGGLYPKRRTDWCIVKITPPGQRMDNTTTQEQKHAILGVPPQEMNVASANSWPAASISGSSPFLILSASFDLRG